MNELQNLFKVLFPRKEFNVVEFQLVATNRIEVKTEDLADGSIDLWRLSADFIGHGRSEKGNFELNK